MAGAAEGADAEVEALLAQARDAHALGLGGGAEAQRASCSSPALDAALDARLAALRGSGVGADADGMAAADDLTDELARRFAALKGTTPPAQEKSSSALPAPSAGSPASAALPPPPDANDAAVAAILAAAEAAAERAARPGEGSGAEDAALVRAARAAARQQPRGAAARRPPPVSAEAIAAALGLDLDSDGEGEGVEGDAEAAEAVVRWAHDAARLEEAVEARGDEALAEALPAVPTAPPRGPRD